MKNLCIIIILFVCVFSANGNEKAQEIKFPYSFLQSWFLDSYIIRIDGCEYIVLVNGANVASNYSLSITHKGNCDNPIHKESK